jgi:hypothetical protein
MPSHLPSLCRFHLRRLWRTQPIASLALIVAASLMAIAATVYGQQWQEAATAKSDMQALENRMRTTERSAAHPDQTQPTLPDFSSTQLVKALHRAAEDTKLPLDEVSFSLDDNGNQPYLRYRATLTISSGYPAIRRFLDRMHEELADVSLDTISCSRDDIASAELTCELVLSAFYRKGGRG